MAGDEVLEELRRNLASALATEEEIISKINKLENCIKTEQFNDITNLNTSVIQDRVIAQVHDVQRAKNWSAKSEFLEHLAGHVLDLDTILSGVAFNVQKIQCTANGTSYMLTIDSGQVQFFLRFLWLEQSKSIKYTQVEFPLEIHRAELASIKHILERHNNVHKVIRIVTEYSEAFNLREKILQDLEGKYGHTFTYKNSENGGYNFQISDRSSGKKYFDANWTVTFFKNENKMDDNFSFNLQEEANALADEQKDIFEALTRKSGNFGNQLNIRKLIGNLIRGFAKRQQE